MTLPWFFWIRRAVRSGGGQPARGRDVRALMWAWFAVVLLFFSIPQSKLVGYILPALPPLAFLLAEGVKTTLVPSERARRLLRAWVALAMAVCVCVVLIVKSQAHDSVTSIVERVQARFMPDDRVLMIDGFAYDVPIYLQLTRPVTLVDTWTDPDIPLHDNSRKELSDAATFAAPAARSVLIEPGAVARAICRPGVTWIFGKPDAAKRYAWLSQAERVDSSTERSVWRWDAGSRTAQTSGLCNG